nr:PREDICTED: centrosomal protein of 112 kDa isoform X2 [Latimeria chalumnae]|eukprot:XP_014341693.1 PREDICTED: centrosomal protein of 112 kDa isoform X2 [Latimeria chalumnae]
MSSQEETWEKLDSEFDHFLVDMKSYVLNLPHKSERQRCALWIKKLCEPSGAGTGVTGRKNRNMYAKLLLHMLRRGVLEGPFIHRPENGMLKTLPSYMSIYFDEPNTTRALSHSPERLPDWVTGELGSSDSRAEESWRISPNEDLISSESRRLTHRRRYTYSGQLTSQSLSPRCRANEDDLGTNTADDQQRDLGMSTDDSDLKAQLNSWNLGIENPRYLREKPIPLSPIFSKKSLGNSSTFYDDQTLGRMHEKENEMKIKMVEAKFHEEKLKLQQKHDADVQKILGRKNNEIEELKTLYRNKQNEAEETIKKLEKKVQNLVRESQVIRESKEKQIEELKKMSDQSTDSLKNEWEKKLHNIVADMEQEKFDLQKKHTENIQELLDDTNARLSKMEAEYTAQTRATNQTVKDLEARVQQLTLEVETSNLLRQKLSQEKAELEQHYQATCLELQEVKTRHNSYQKEKHRLTEEYDQYIKQMKNKHNSDANFLKQEHAVSAAKAADVIEELELTVSRLKQQLQEGEHQRQQQLQDQEGRFQQEKLQVQHIHEKKVHAMQTQMEKESVAAQKRIHNLEEAYREKEEQLTRLKEMQRLQAQQADAALEEFKQQVERNSEKVYTEMKQQMEKVEADLSRSKSLREKQSKEFTCQLEELKQRYEQQIVELKLEHEQEKTHLFQQHNTEKDCLVQDHEREIEKLEKQLRAAMLEHETKTQEWRKRDAQNNSRLKQIEKEYSQKLAKSSQAIAELQTTISSLREEKGRQQLATEKQLQESMGKFEDEKRQLVRENDRAIKALQDEMENCRNQVRSVEKKLQHKELETQEQVTHIRQEYEMKMKGLMPLALRQELEDTITSLKSQVNFLQKRASVLQEELNAYYCRR